ncbi:MAG: SDR family oxidoreductase, partial [Melioribacteraceae bacterium]|nr:SDR family oxidoreductase [Melioribacteraceae bacterium]
KAPFNNTDLNLNDTTNFRYIENDVSNFDQVAAISKEIQENYSLECLINNAGITSFKPFIENSIEDIDKIIKTNLNGSIYTIKSVLPQMIENQSGTIINILSVAAKKIFTNSSIYAASKAGLELFSKVLREEIREHNIRIINIYPGATSTEIWPENAIDKFSDKMMSPEKLAKFIFDIYSNSSDISPEEIVIRPITGDL